jgi:hypothetical protein
MKTTVSNGNNRSGNLQESEIVKEDITYESALREEGIDEAFVARKLKDLLRAKGQRWDPKKGSWEKFEDYGTQLAALREIAKISGIYAKDSEDADVPTTINISAIPRCRERVSTNGEQSIGAEAGDGRERRER